MLLLWAPGLVELRLRRLLLKPVCAFACLMTTEVPEGRSGAACTLRRLEKGPHGRDFVQWTERLRRAECEVWSGWQVIDCAAPGTLRTEREDEVRDVE